MNLAKYKKCKFHKILPKKPKKAVIKRKARTVLTVLDDSKYDTPFMNFVKNGGSWSFRTNSPLV